MKLSILVLSTHTRRNTFLPKSLDMIYGQIEQSPHKNEVEVLYLIDNRCMTVGDKRNRIKSIATGDYIAFVDDDDRISDNYINELIAAIEYDQDVITFKCQVQDRSGEIKMCYYSLKYNQDFDFGQNCYRIPNPRVCVKRAIANRVQFRDISLGEDYYFGVDIKPLVETEYFINKVLYYYDFNAQTTETQWQ